MFSLLCTILLSVCLASTVYSDASNSSATSPPEGEVRVFARVGENVTLPCRLQRTSPANPFGTGIRIKWTKLSDDESTAEDVLTAMGFHKKSYGRFQGRVHLSEVDDEDASLVIEEVTIEDLGKFHCEVINGMDDDTADIILEVQGGQSQGVVFPYSPRLGRYNLNFHDAEQACQDQGASVASFDQLYEAWRTGLDWCNAGWLNDGSVQYPITNPREPCGGTKAEAGLRSYGRRDKSSGRYDVFCFTPSVAGQLYWLVQPLRLTYDEAVQACLDDGAEIANVGQMYAAWKMQGFDRCDAGWLADGSVRYPISRPRKNCSPTEAAVRFVGFPDKKQKLYGVYCLKLQQ